MSWDEAKPAARDAWERIEVVYMDAADEDEAASAGEEDEEQ